jgi:hypothetical protein
MYYGVFMAKTALLQVRMDPSDLERFQGFCERTKRTTASEVVRQWVYEAMDGPPVAPQPVGGQSPAHPFYTMPDGKKMNRKQTKAMGVLTGRRK